MKPKKFKKIAYQIKCTEVILNGCNAGTQPPIHHHARANRALLHGI